MPEVTSGHAAEILRIAKTTLLVYVNDGRLPARRQGLNRAVYVQVDDLRTFAAELGYRFDETLAQQYAVE